MSISTSTSWLMILVVSIIIIVTLSGNHQVVHALFGPNITISLTDPGTFSSTYSPRRIAVETTLTFSDDSNVIGPVEASIPVTAASTLCRFTRFHWFQAGTFVTPQTYQITFRNPILTWNAFEQDAFDAMSTIYLTVGASSRARITSASACVFFERLSVLFIDYVQREFQDAESRCAGSGGFLATLLKPTDEAEMVSQLTSTGTSNFWVGGYAVDNRPADTLYCWRSDPDFEESGCTDGGYYAYFRVTQAGGAAGRGVDTAGVQCIRPPGITCAGYSMDWDSGDGGGTNIGTLTWNFRLRWTGSDWVHWDRRMNISSITMGSLCTTISPYDHTPGDVCHSPAIEVENPSLSKSITESLTRSRSLSFSKTHSKSKSDSAGTVTHSHSFSKTISKSFSLSQTFSHSSTVTKSVSFSKTHTLTKNTASISKSVSETGRTKSLSKSRTKTKSKSKSQTLVTRTKKLTASHSMSLTGGSRTPTFLFFDVCSEGWIRFGRHCFKHFPVTTSLSQNASTPTAMTFADALKFCEEKGATIVPIQNDAHLQFLQEQVVGLNSGRRFWNGVYRDSRFTDANPTWRTVYNRTGFNDFFHWDTKRRMPGYDDCVVHHIRGDLGKRIVGGNDAMVTYPCHGRAEVVCGRLKDPWSVTSINQTTEGPLLVTEGHYVTLSVVGRRLPPRFFVQLQTTTYQTHSGPEGQPTHCAQTKPRNSIPLNGSSSPAMGQNITRTFYFDRLCNGTCERAVLRFPSPEQMGLVRGHKYSVCFFFPYDYDLPLSSDEYRWDFLPNLYLEVAQSRKNYLSETCERRRHLIDLLYFDPTATDATRIAPSPWYFDGPLQPNEYWGRPGLT